MDIKYLKTGEILEFFNNQNGYDIHEELPMFNEIKEGSFFFFLNQTSVSDVRDLSYDQFSPWSGSAGSVRKTGKNEKRYLVIEDGNFVLHTNQTDLVLRSYKNQHRSLTHFSREIHYILLKGALNSHVLFVYKSQIYFVFEPAVETSNKLLPSQIKIIKQALSKRTTDAAKNVLLEEGLRCSKRTLSSIRRSVPDHQKTKKGRKSPLDFHTVIDRYVAAVNPEELLAQPVVKRMENGKIKIRLMVGYPTAVSCFAEALPSIDELESYRKVVDSVNHICRKEAEFLLKSYLSTATHSGSVPLIGNCLMIDTTFSLTTAEYVTIVLGVSDVFLSKSSKKNASMLLAYMIHTSKELEDHNSFSIFLNELFDPFKTKKQLGTVVHDGEVAFDCYSSGSFLGNAKVLRCDIHRAENIKNLLRGEPEEYEFIKKKLWGERSNISGSQVLKRGVLNSLSFEEYSIEMKTFINSLSNEKLKSWLTHNFDSLFQHSSMNAKFYGGWPIQFMTTNIIESKNAEIKTLVDCKMAAHKLLDCFLRIHKEEVEERKKAIVGENSKLTATEWYSSGEWNKKTTAEKKYIFGRYGLGAEFRIDILDDIPRFLIPDRTVTREQLLDQVNGQKVYRFEDKHFFLRNSSNESSYMEKTCSDLVCFHFSCTKSKSKKLCHHKLAVLLHISQDERKKIIDELEKKRGDIVSCTAILRNQSKPHHGTKYNCRKGAVFSKNNMSRKLDAVINTTASTIDMETSYTKDLDSSDDY